VRHAVLLQARRGAARIEDAEMVLGGPQVLKLARKAGWLKPVVERKRLTIFDYDECLACWNRIRVEGFESLEEAASE